MIIRGSIAKAHGLPVQAAKNVNVVNVSGEKIKMIAQIALSISHRGRTIRAIALVAEKLNHKLIILWRDCICLEVVPNTFPFPPTTGHVNDIQNEAKAIKEMITNKYDIIRDDISHNTDYTGWALQKPDNGEKMSLTGKLRHRRARSSSHPIHMPKM